MRHQHQAVAAAVAAWGNSSVGVDSTTDDSSAGGDLAMMRRLIRSNNYYEGPNDNGSVTEQTVATLTAKWGGSKGGK